MREIASNEVCKLENCLSALAAHHNKVSVNFKGCYPKTPVEQTIQHFADDLDSGKSYISVVEKDNMIIGFCKIDIDGSIGVLEYLIVLDDYRGFGYGGTLMEWALSKFADCKVHDIDVKVADGNNAVTLYEKYGFRMNAHILRLSR